MQTDKIQILSHENGHITFNYQGLDNNLISIVIRDINTQQIIYSDSFPIAPSNTYWVSINHIYSYIRNILVNFTLDTGEIYNFNINYPDNPNRHTVVNNNLFLFDGGENHSMYTIREVFYDKIYDTDYVKVTKDDVVVDLGANIGVFSVYCQNHNPKFVYSVEPDPTTFKLLTKNTSQFSNIKCINAAISDFDGESDFIHFPQSSAVNHLVKNQGIINYTSNQSQIIKTPTFNINTFINQNNISYINYLKVDIEGSELDVFKEINKDYLNNCIKKIAIEYHTNEIKNELIEILESQEFIIENNEIKPKDIHCGMLYAYK